MPATRTLRLEISKDNTSRIKQKGPGGTTQGSGHERHWLVGKLIEGGSNGRTDVYRTYASVAEGSAYGEVDRVLTADLVVRGNATHIDQGGNISRLKMRPTSATWGEGTNGEDSWSADEYVNARLHDEPTVTSQQLDPGVTNRIDIMELLRFWAPGSIRFRIGGVDKAGRNHENKGFRIWSDDEDKSSHAFECCSTDHGTPSVRPYVEITYEPRYTKPTGIRIAPSGSVADGPTFIVGMSDDDPDQRIGAYQLQVRRVSDQVKTWTPAKVMATAAEQATGSQGQCSVVAPLGQWSIGKEQEWTVKVWDNEAKPSESDWTPWGNPFTVTGGVPTIGTPTAIGTVANMAGVRFIALWTHPEGKAIASLRIQLRASTAPGSPLWDGTDNAWDTGAVTPTLTEQDGSATSPAHQINRRYEGDSLEAGSYSWRVMVTDVLGAQSAWAYGTLVLSADYDVEDPGAGDNVGYSRQLSGFRIILRGMGTKRGPGAIRAVIEDALNVGMSSYASAPGECYFTLPATHPQVGECEPWRTHCSYEQYRNGKWQEIWAGLLTDFDATGDDVVINGIDYLGLLSLDIERRAWNSGDAKDKKPKYFNKSISSIIADQLDEAIATTDSPVGFITRPDSGTSFNVLSTPIVIDASYRQRLEFIRGLLDSFRAGTGVRSRIVVRRKQGSTADETHGYGYAFNLLADSGTNRKALRLEWGGLIQGFRILGFGDFAVKVYGIGREVNELKPHYKSGSAPNMPTATWGNLAKVAVWQDIDDESDLARRVAQLAAESGRVGKRMALGLRVRGLGPFDGWDITDSVPIDIVRGVVDTGHFAPDPPGSPTAGLSWWTIWGTEWRWYPDGHDELTLVVRPREDSNPPDPDLVIAKPFEPTPEWTLAPGAPDAATLSPLTAFYLDTETNDVYERVDDPVTGEASYVLQAEGGGGGGGEPPDTTPPGVVTALTMEGTVYLREDGTLVSAFDISWTPPADPDVEYYDVELDADPAFSSPLSRSPTAPSVRWEPVTALAITGIEAEPTPVVYHVRVRAVDGVGNKLDWADPTTPPPVVSGTAPTDPWAPDIPENVTPAPGYRLVSLSWPRVDFADLSRYGVRYTAAKRDEVTGEFILPLEPDLDAWIDLSTLSTRIVITNLIPGDHYWFEVRAIDRSGQVRAYRPPEGDEVGPQPIAVYASQEGEAGWSDRREAVPEALAPDDVSPMEDVQDFLATGTFDADLIKTGTIRLDSDPHLEVFDPAGRLLMRLDANGLLVLDPAKPNRAVWVNAAEVRVSDAFTGSVGTTSWRAAVAAEGLDATAIAFGVMPGGHNNIPNSAFELVPFPTTVASVATVKTWTATADWATGTSQVNVTTSGADLTLTTATF